MIRKNLRTIILTSVVTLLPIIAGLALWADLPAELPIHWNAAGEVDGYCSKVMAVIGMPLLLLCIHWLLIFALQFDPKRQGQSDKMITLSLWITPALSVILSAVTMVVGMGTDVPVGAIVSVFLGLTLTVIGNYMPKCRQSYTVGIKLPWTLNSEENWNRTHRMAGWLWMFGGVMIMVLGAFAPIIATLPFVMAMTLAPIIYSFVLYKKGI